MAGQKPNYPYAAKKTSIPAQKLNCTNIYETYQLVTK